MTTPRVKICTSARSQLTQNNQMPTVSIYDALTMERSTRIDGTYEFRRAPYVGRGSMSHLKSRLAVILREIKTEKERHNNLTVF